MEQFKEIILNLNWVDFIIMIMLISGALVGRKRGMSQEMLDLLQWLLTVVLGAMLCLPLGTLIDGTARLGTMWSRVAAYLFVLVVIMVIFVMLKKMVGEKIVGSDVFGGMEFYLGIMAGIVRFACMIIVLMALLNARYISQTEISNTLQQQKETFGKMSFPTHASLQKDVFQVSTFGKLVKRYLNDQLISPSQGNADWSNSVGRQRGRTVDEAIGGHR